MTPARRHESEHGKREQDEPEQDNRAEHAGVEREQERRIERVHRKTRGDDSAQAGGHPANLTRRPDEVLFSP
jgi:hypothetical protein